MFLLVPTGNPPSLRFGHPDVTTEDTTPPPRRKNTRPRFSKGRACVRDTGITNWRGRDCRLLNLLLALPSLFCDARPPLRVPDVTTEDTIPPPRRKNTRPGSIRAGLVCAIPA